jgi:superfamily I DNA/RNA helicase
MSEVAVARSFLQSARRFGAQDRARIFDFLDKFYENPARPGVNLEAVRGARDPNMRSARVTRGIRAIVHRTDQTSVLLYVDEHDKAYRWAEQRSLARHPVTRDFQIVAAGEVVRSAVDAVTPPARSAPLFAAHDDAYLLSIGVPREWLPAVREIRDEDQLLAAAAQSPEADEVWEVLMRLASGEVVVPPAPARADRPIGGGAEEQRRFWVVGDSDELRDLLKQPFDDWIRFLHPSQRELAAGAFRGPVKVTGSAGTGKTVVALHRAAHLARQGRRVLLTSFVTTLCKNLERNLAYLLKPAELRRVTVSTIHKQALQLAREAERRLGPCTDAEVRDRINRHAAVAARRFDALFLHSEWRGVVQPQGVESWAEYRGADRTGRGTGLTAQDRKLAWGVFERVLAELVAHAKLPWPHLCKRARDALASGRASSPYEAVVVDEIQDLGPQEIRLLAALASPAPENLMIVGDAGQRIYPGGFTLKALGINVTGRAHVLRINYRTTEQIRRAADRLLPDAADDLDGGAEGRGQTRSLLRGPAPTLKGFRRPADQHAFLRDRIQDLLRLGMKAPEIALFTRSSTQWPALQSALAEAGVAVRLLSNEADAGEAEGANLGTMHRAKGLEFKAVFLPDCSAANLPSPAALDGAVDAVERRLALERERQLLYVGMTRARDEVFVTWVGAPSPFLSELAAAGEEAP